MNFISDSVQLNWENPFRTHYRALGRNIISMYAGTFFSNYPQGTAERMAASELELKAFIGRIAAEITQPGNGIVEAGCAHAVPLMAAYHFSGAETTAIDTDTASIMAAMEYWSEMQAERIMLRGANPSAMAYFIDEPFSNLPKHNIPYQTIIADRPTEELEAEVIRAATSEGRNLVYTPMIWGERIGKLPSRDAVREVFAATYRKVRAVATALQGRGFEVEYGVINPSEFPRGIMIAVKN